MLNDKLNTSQLSNTAYSSEWNGKATTAPSKDAVYDKIEAMDYAYDISYSIVTGDVILNISDGSTQSAVIPNSSTTVKGLMTTAQYYKLDSIEHGAEKNVNADYNATSGDAVIFNKPDLSVYLKFLDTVNKIATKKDLVNYAVSGSGFFNKVEVTNDTMEVIFGRSMIGANYFLDVKAWYIDSINGKEVQVSNSIYDFTKNQEGFSMVLGEASGYIQYLALDSVNYDVALSNRPVSQTLTFIAEKTIMDAQLGWDAVLTMTNDCDTLEITNLYNGSEGQIAVIQNATGGFGIDAVYVSGCTTKYHNNLPPDNSVINTDANGHTLISYKRLGNYVYVTYGNF
jgi:hypothetical protein